MPTLTDEAAAVKPLRPNLAECLEWTPGPRPFPCAGCLPADDSEPEYRPTFSDYQAPTPEAEAYILGFRLGFECEIALPSSDYSAAESGSWVLGYCDGKRERWAEYASAMERIEAMHADPDPHDERRNTASAFQGHDYE